MSAVPAAIKAAIEPQVNLLPPEVTARRARGRRRGLVGLGFAGFILLAGVSVYLASAQNASAQRDLKDAVDAGAAIQAQIDGYQYVLDIQGELASASNARTFVGSVEIRWTDLLGEIGAALPADASIDTLTYKAVSVLSDPEAGTGPFDKPDIGVVQISGQLGTYITGAALEEALDSVHGLARARIDSVTRQDNSGVISYTFGGTVRLTALALSGRFSPEWIAKSHRAEASVALALKVAAAQTTAEYDAANADASRLDAALRAVAGAETSVSDLKEQVAAGVEGADVALASAQGASDALTPAVDALVEAVRDWYDAATNEAYVKTRIAAAQSWLATAEAAVAAAEAVVAAGTEGAGEALRDAQTGQFNAQASVDEEQGYLADAQAATVTTRAALDAAFDTAGVAVEAYLTGGGTS